MKMHMKVTKDEFSLPIYVSESRKELARYCGITPEYLSQQICKDRRKENPTYIAVEIDEKD
jgi:hypothetical protein